MRRKWRLSGLADEELMPLVASKQVEAFELFHDRHAGAAYSLAHRILGDPKLAEDVTQEAFLSIWRSESGYDPARGSVRSWALGIVRNRAIDAIRRASSVRRPRLELTGGELLERERIPGAGPEEQTIKRETARALKGGVAELPPDQARVIVLAYYGGFSQCEIAQMLGVPLGTVKGRARLALERIRALHAEGLA